MEAVLNYALNSFPVIVSVVSLPTDSEKFLNLTVDAWTVVLGFSSIVIAMVALLFSVSQAKATRRHNSLMVSPHLDHRHLEKNDEKVYQFEMKNDGIGPAILKSAQIYVDSQPINTQIDQVQAAIRKLFPGISDEQFGHETIDVDSYIAVGQVITLMTISVPADKCAEDFRRIVSQRAYLIAIYESIYGESFTYDSRL